MALNTHVAEVVAAIEHAEKSSEHEPKRIRRVFGRPFLHFKRERPVAHCVAHLHLKGFRPDPKGDADGFETEGRLQTLRVLLCGLCVLRGHGGESDDALDEATGSESEGYAGAGHGDCGEGACHEEAYGFGVDCEADGGDVDPGEVGEEEG